MSKQISNSARLYSNFLRPGNWIFWITLSLILKSGLFIFKINEPTEFPNVTYLHTIAREAGDSRSYIDPIENLIAEGNYYSHISFNYIGSTIYYGDYRMPGYGAVYFLLRLFFDQPAALNGLVILQLAVSSVSVYILALLALQIFKTNVHFYLTFLLYVTSTFITLFDHVIATESFCVSGLIFALYFLVRPGNTRLNLLWSGMFLTWCVFLRPVLAPLLMLFAFYILFKCYSENKKHITACIKPLMIFLIPFLITDGYWIYRNYKVHKGFHPLTTSVLYTGIEGSVLGAVYNFVQSYGGSIVGWKSTSEINYFVPGSSVQDVRFPDNIFNNKFNTDSLAEVKQLIIEIEDPATAPVIREEKSRLAIAKLNRFAGSIKEETPVLYYFTSKISYMKSFFLHSGSGYLFEKPAGELPVPALILKVYSSLLYFIILILGFTGSVLFLLYGIKQEIYLLLGAAGLYLSLIFPIFLKMDEFRYFAPAYPLFLMASVFVVLKVSQLIKKRTHQNV